MLLAELIALLFYLCLFAFIGYVLYVIFGKTRTVKSHWQTFIDGMQIEHAEFYEMVRNGLKAMEVPHFKAGEMSRLESHIFSAKRIYLWIKQEEYVFYICTAPYGTGTFFSSWFCEENERVIHKIPIISKMLGKDRNRKTLYQMDTEQMFLTAVHSAVIGAVESVAEAKGKRGLTELQKQLKDIR